MEKNINDIVEENSVLSNCVFLRIEQARQGSCLFN